MASSSSKLTTTTTTASKAIRRVKLTKTIQKTLPDVSVPITVQKVNFFLSKNSSDFLSQNLDFKHTVKRKVSI